MHFPWRKWGVGGGAINGRVRTAFHLTRFRFINGIKYNTYTLIYIYMCVYRDSSEASKVACWVESLNTVGGETKFPRYLWAGRPFFYIFDFVRPLTWKQPLLFAFAIRNNESVRRVLSKVCIPSASLSSYFFVFRYLWFCGPWGGSDVNVRESFPQKQACSFTLPWDSLAAAAAAADRHTDRRAAPMQKNIPVSTWNLTYKNNNSNDKNLQKSISFLLLLLSSLSFFVFKSPLRKDESTTKESSAWDVRGVLVKKLRLVVFGCYKRYIDIDIYSIYCVVLRTGLYW